MDEFPQSVVEALGHYVYRLEDPRDGKTFYVGKGVANRAFQHARDALSRVEPTDKLEQIREILGLGLKPRIIVHRHGLDEETAFQVEAALIDAYGVQQIANQQRGQGVAQGMMSLDEVVELYAAPEAEITEPVMLIKIEQEWRRDLKPEQLYERTRRYWLANPQARKPPPQFAMAVARGIIRAVYEIEYWEYFEMDKEQPDPTRMHCYALPAGQRRIGFIGRLASDKKHYVGQSVRKLQNTGNQNPIRYINC